MKTKKGVSEMVSYVLLVAITIGVSITVYSWLKYQIPNCSETDPDCFIQKDCKGDTSIIINGYYCDSNGINLTLLNNGRFNISGVILAVTDTAGQIPNSYLIPKGSRGTRIGEFIFRNPLKPGEESTISFSSYAGSNQRLSKIEEIKLQIFLFEGNGKVICKDVLIKEPIRNCNMPQI